MKSERVWMALLFTFSLVLFTTIANAAVEMEQSISYAKGWNLVYVKVVPNMSADELFKDWPVESVSLYDPAAYLDTKQYSAEESTEGTTRNVMRVWRRGNPGANGFVAVPADSLLMFKASAAGACTIVGTPCAPRISWHQTSSDAPRNYVGISVWADVPLADYFSGSGVLASDCATVWGTGDVPQQAAFFNGQQLKDGMALAVNALRPGDWSGVLNVSPRDGIDFGTEGTKATLSVRNDGASSATVSVAMFGESPGVVTDINPVPPGLFVRDTLTALTNGPWKAFTAGEASRLERTLAAGETWTIVFALDRLQMGSAAGTEYGAILDIRDETPNGSRMRVNVPIGATSDGGASSEYAWPKGVWIATAALDEVSFFLTKEGESVGDTGDVGVKPAGGKMTVRLPLYVDERGAMTLLQRFWYGRDTNGVLRAYSGAVETSDEPLTGVKRVSTAFLPADMPQLALGLTNYVSYVEVVTNVVDVTNDVGEVIEQETKEVEVVRQMPVSSNVFGTYALAEFTVGEKSNVNPMRHAQHPRHDGLMADYLADAPSGDDLSNYMGTVKPEAFSVKNRIEFTWDTTQAASWNPEERLSGTLKWEFEGIRHEGAIQARGRFAMKRLSPVTMKMR